MGRPKTNAIAEFGDFQTPAALAERVCALLAELGVRPASIVEPTCGRGAFVLASADCWPSAVDVSGFELNPSHLSGARDRVASRADASRIRIQSSDFFRTDWSQILGSLPEPILAIGNPPWVTNAHVSSLGGSNVPEKSNFQRHTGFDAITGKANFDISEWMLIRLADSLNRRDAVLAMLVKTVVARKVLYHCWKHDLCVANAHLFRIDASSHFDAAVDASLIVLRFGESRKSTTAEVFGQLSTAIGPIATVALADETLVADLDAYQRTKHLRGASPLKWRSGIKHDCSKVMELHRRAGQFRNGLGETVEIEPDYLYPMLKTSEVAGEKSAGTRWMVVPQQRIGEGTARIAERAPKTWEYLQTHEKALAKRGSSIYRGKPPFSIFGVGDYSFAPWKIAISGMYKVLRFVKVGPCEGKPVVLDDTTNFMPCPSEASADLLLSMLDSAPARMFYGAFIFWDAKRPITVELLSRLNLYALASELDALAEFERYFDPASDRAKKRGYTKRVPVPAPTLW